ncbi:MAG: Hsp20/alpha crystallin family protein [Candidatus Marinimicrobia bacterium]|nr:Hsp20/alpha crystallin family protein [Candidatus Neomarinimicrobiota bacterium]
MSLIRWNPTRNLRVFNDEIDNYLNDFWNGEDSYLSKFTPNVDIEELDDEFQFHAELPGLEKKDVIITVKENVLTISGEKQSKKEEKNKNYHRIESSFGKFQRSFRLPQNVDQNAIKAEFKNGILDVIIPKTETAKPKEIEIKVN